MPVDFRVGDQRGFLLFCALFPFPAPLYSLLTSIFAFLNYSFVVCGEESSGSSRYVAYNGRDELNAGGTSDTSDSRELPSRRPAHDTTN